MLILACNYKNTMVDFVCFLYIFNLGGKTLQKYSIRSALFFTFFAVIVLLNVVLLCSYLFFTYPIIQEQTFASLQHNTENVQSAIDSNLKQMSNVALNIAYSSFATNQFYYDPSVLTADDDKANHLNELSNLLSYIIGPARPIDQIYLYNRDGINFSYGLFNDPFVALPQDQEWFPFISQDTQHKHVYFSGQDEHLSMYRSDPYSKNFISYIVKYISVFNETQGYIELKRSAGAIFASAIDYKSIYGESLYLFDKDGKQIYPLNDSHKNDLYFTMETHQGATSSAAIYDKVNKRYLFFAPSNESNFVSIMSIPQACITQNVSSYLYTNIVVSIVIMFLGMYATWLVTKAWV